MIRRSASLGSALLLLLSACQAPVAPPASSSAATPAKPTAIASSDVTEPLGLLACHDDVDTTTVTTDRGIGGTGISGAGIAHQPGEQQISDRGIGGTGVSAGATTGSVDVTRLRGRAPIVTADRGMGGTGIVGTITGFASVCLNGLEVGINTAMAITEDGVPEKSATLKLGELAAIDASGTSDGLRAVSIAVRHEVSGPILRMDGAAGALRLDVAGQPVVLSHGARIAAGLKAGDWVAVSGLRDHDRIIHATRIDRRAPGGLVVSGQPELVGGQWKIGGLTLLFKGKPPADGGRWMLSGAYDAGTLYVDAMRADHVAPEGAKEHRLLVEGYAAANDGKLRLSQGLQADIGPEFGSLPPSDQTAIVEFVVGTDSNLVAVGWRLSRGNHAASEHPVPVIVPQTPVNVPVTAAPAVPATATATPATATASTTTASTTATASSTASSVSASDTAAASTASATATAASSGASGTSGSGVSRASTSGDRPGGEAGDVGGGAGSRSSVSASGTATGTSGSGSSGSGSGNSGLGNSGSGNTGSGNAGSDNSGTGTSGSSNAGSGSGSSNSGGSGGKSSGGGSHSGSGGTSSDAGGSDKGSAGSGNGAGGSKNHGADNSAHGDQAGGGGRGGGGN